MTICFTLPYSGPVKRELNLIFWQQLLNAPSWLQLSPEANVAHQARARAKILPLPLYHCSLSFFSLDFFKLMYRISLQWFKDCLWKLLWFLLAVAWQDAGWRGERGLGGKGKLSNLSDQSAVIAWKFFLWCFGNDGVRVGEQMLVSFSLHSNASKKRVKG